MPQVDTPTGTHTGTKLLIAIHTGTPIRVTTMQAPWHRKRRFPLRPARHQATSTAPIANTAMTTPEAVCETTGRSSAALLQLMWLASPTLPIGGFSYSEGLEAAVDSGLVSDEASATHWLTDQLHLGLGRGELVVVAQAIAAWREQAFPRLQALNDWVHHTRESDELRQQTVQMGSSLMSWRKSLGEPIVGWDTSALGAITYPVAFASALAATGASVREGLLTFAFGWAENMAQAAIKSVPLGQSAGQRMVMRLKHEIPKVVEAALLRGDEDRQAFTPMLALLSAQHEMQYSRLFRS